jgi:predicted glutamine amidotransferase
MNCVLSDGTHLFAYHDKNGYNGLHYLAKSSKKIGLGVVVATKPLGDEKWTSFVPGRLMAWKDGVQVFPKPPAEGKEKE